MIETAEADADRVLDTMERMLSSAESICGYRKSPLYEHMTFKEISGEFKEKFKQNLKNAFQNDEAFGFLKEDRRWKELAEKK